jgi:tetratricopeptide (TPR) repeat protein
MPNSPAPSFSLPVVTAEQRRLAQESFARARDALNNQQLDYAIELLLTCCRIDPANVLYRQTLRKAQKDKYNHNLRGSRFAFLTTPCWKARIKAAKRARDYLKVLEYGEQVLCRNPWDLGTQLDMAEAFDALGLIDLAVFTLDQARQKYPKNATLNRALARLFEKRGDFQKAIILWQLVKEAHPTDVEAAHKAKDLAARDTIQRGQYEQVLEGSRESPVVGHIEARAQEKQDRYSREVDALLKRIEADPTEPSLYLQLARLHRDHQNWERARAVLEQGLGPTGQAFALQLELLELDLAPLRHNLDLVEARLQQAGQKSSPINAIKAPTGSRSDQLPPGDLTSSELEQLRAQLQAEIQRREIDLYRLKADRFPEQAVYRLELGERLLQAGQAEAAIVELQQARRDERLRWKAAWLLGQAFQLRNNWRLAQRNYEEALQLLPSNEQNVRKEILYALAQGSAACGDLQRALDLGHELANLDYSYRGIGRLIEEWNDRLQSA